MPDAADALLANPERLVCMYTLPETHSLLTHPPPSRTDTPFYAVPETKT